MDLDGFPELFLTLRMKPTASPDGAEYIRSFVLMNEECCKMKNSNEGEKYCVCNKEQNEADRRFFSNVNQTFAVQTISELAGDSSLMLVPFDIDEDGRMDVIVQHGSATGGAKRLDSLSVIYNNHFSDANFIKAQMVNIEEAPDGSENMGPIGGIALGATFRYIFTSNDGEHFVRVASLIP